MRPVRRGRALPTLTAVTLTAALALTVTLTGCSRFGSHDGSTSTPAPASSAGAEVSTPATDPSSLAGITQDLNSADDAASQAQSNAQSGDQAAATGDEP